MNKCINCGGDLTAKRKGTKFCCDKCKLYYNRHTNRINNDANRINNDTDKPLTVSNNDTDKSQNMITNTTTSAKPKIVNRTFDGTTPFANEEMDKVNVFIQEAIAKKIEQGPDYPLNNDKFTKDGAFITYFK